MEKPPLLKVGKKVVPPSKSDNIAPKTNDKAMNKNLGKQAIDLRQALVISKTIVTSCCLCKKIKRRNGRWERIDGDMESDTRFLVSHGICPDCAQTHYPE